MEGIASSLPGVLSTVIKPQHQLGPEQCLSLELVSLKISLF